jgi:hypothetical protein
LWEKYKEELEKKFEEPPKDLGPWSAGLRVGEDLKEELKSWIDGKVPELKDEIIEWLLEELKKAKYRRGLKGEPGPQGPRGSDGRPGKDGTNFPHFFLRKKSLGNWNLHVI